MAKFSAKLTYYRTGLLVLVTLDILAAVTAQSPVRKLSSNTACYSSQAWLSCLLDPCRFSLCPSFPSARCIPTRTPCDGCRAEFYFNERRVNCYARPTTCPPSVPVVECAVNPCLAQRCPAPAFEKAACRPSYCGNCHAQYFVGNQWRTCPLPVGSLPIDAVVRQFDPVPAPSSRCAPGEKEVACTEEVCLTDSCPAFPNAVCRPHGCGACRPNWYVGSQLVDCQSRNCPAGIPEVRCIVNPCNYFKCGRYPKADCRPNNCGSCKADFFVNNTLVNCAQAGQACPNGEAPETCPKNTCRVSICPVNIKAMCRVNSCGGCFAEFHIDNEVVPCEGWWSHTYDKKKFSPAETTPADTATVVGQETSTMGSLGQPDVPLFPGPVPNLPPQQPDPATGSNTPNNPLLPGSVPTPPPQAPVLPPFRNNPVAPGSPLLPGSVPVAPPQVPVRPPFRNNPVVPGSPLLPGSVPASPPQVPVRPPFRNNPVAPGSPLLPGSVPASPPQVPVRTPFRNNMVAPGSPLLPGSVPAAPPQVPVRPPFRNTPVAPEKTLLPGPLPVAPRQVPVRPPFRNAPVSPVRRFTPSIFDLFTNRPFSRNQRFRSGRRREGD